MDSTVKTRPNHYELLGLVPSASDAQIAGAFVRAMALFPPMAACAQIGLAYEVLRDPARRRAYDDSLGLRPEPKPIDAPRAVTFRGSAHFNGSAVVDAQPTAGRPPAPEPRHPPEDLREPRPEPEAMLGPTPEPEAMLEPEPESFVAAPFAPDIAAPHATRADPAVNGESQAEGFDWRRPLLGIGGVVLAAAAIGAWAGMQAGSDAEAQTRAQAVTVPVPRAAPTVAIAPDPMVQAQPRRRVRAPALRRAVARAAPVAAEAEPPAAADPAPGEVSAADPLAPEASPVAAAAPALPLSHAAIAHTIGRIGYACGRVASTSAPEGAGAFKVTCTSGDTYRASPVRGRYRFKRL